MNIERLLEQAKHMSIDEVKEITSTFQNAMLAWKISEDNRDEIINMLYEKYPALRD